ncbi:hypothetical protein ACIPRL_08065 [Streptomyces sp. NPDC090085]|uniref:hypothetical protein n=1 Tax=Streptomyces sp. NPDC090085 TaxID=3365943 RepID=UPI0037F220AF
MPNSLPIPEAPDGHAWVRPESTPCPACLCHTERVCTEHDWHRASRPEYSDGTPYTEPCPCEEAAVPEPRTLTATLNGTTRDLPVILHRRGWLTGQLTTLNGHPGAVFTADIDDLDQPAHVRGRFEADPDGAHQDDTGTRWNLALQVSHGGRPGRITGWAPPRHADNAQPLLQQDEFGTG